MGASADVDYDDCRRAMDKWNELGDSAVTDSDFNSRHAFEAGGQLSFCQHTTRLSVRSSRVMTQSGRLVLRSGQLTCPETLRTRLRRQGMRELGRLAVVARSVLLGVQPAVSRRNPQPLMIRIECGHALDFNAYTLRLNRTSPWCTYSHVSLPRS